MITADDIPSAFSPGARTGLPGNPSWTSPVSSGRTALPSATDTQRAGGSRAPTFIARRRACVDPGTQATRIVALSRPHCQATKLGLPIADHQRMAAAFACIALLRGTTSTSTAARIMRWATRGPTRPSPSPPLPVLFLTFPPSFGLYRHARRIFTRPASQHDGFCESPGEDAIFASPSSISYNNRPRDNKVLNPLGGG